MGTALKNDSRASVSAGELWSVTWLYGYHSGKDKVENDNTSSEFGERVDLFISEHLHFEPEAANTQKTLKNLFYPRKYSPGKRNPVPRNKVVSLELINELTMLWACRLILLGWRGFARGGELDATLSRLKLEVVWLLGRYGYILPAEHAVACPILTRWEDYPSLWRAIRDNDAGRKLEVPPTDHALPEHPACRQCVADYRAALI